MGKPSSCKDVPSYFELDYHFDDPLSRNSTRYTVHCNTGYVMESNCDSDHFICVDHTSGFQSWKDGRGNDLIERPECVPDRSLVVGLSVAIPFLLLITVLLCLYRREKQLRLTAELQIKIANVTSQQPKIYEERYPQARRPSHQINVPQINLSYVPNDVGYVPNDDQCVSVSQSPALPRPNVVRENPYLLSAPVPIASQLHRNNTVYDGDDYAIPKVLKRTSAKEADNVSDNSSHDYELSSTADNSSISTLMTNTIYDVPLRGNEMIPLPTRSVVNSDHKPPCLIAESTADNSEPISNSISSGPALDMPTVTNENQSEI